MADSEDKPNTEAMQIHCQTKEDGIFWVGGVLPTTEALCIPEIFVYGFIQGWVGGYHCKKPLATQKELDKAWERYKRDINHD